MNDLEKNERLKGIEAVTTKLDDHLNAMIFIENGRITYIKTIQIFEEEDCMVRGGYSPSNNTFKETIYRLLQKFGQTELLHPEILLKLWRSSGGNI